MENHLLITISDDVSALYGIHFVKNFFSNKSRVSITLFYIAPMIESPEHELSDDAFTVHTLTDERTKRNREIGMAALDRAESLLVSSGFDKKNVFKKLSFRQFGTVRDIIQEAKHGMYDAVVLGKRGTNFMQGMFSTDSVTKSIVSEEIDFPVWICRMPDPKRKNILICTDDTEPCIRAADHVGFIVRGEPEHSVTIIHVSPHEDESTQVFDRTIEAVMSNGVPRERITYKSVIGDKVVPSVMHEVETGGYAAVAVGRSEREQGFLRRLLESSPSTKLLETLKKSALWLSK